MPVPVPHHAPIGRRWLTVNESAVYMSVHPRTIRKKIAAGVFPAYRLNRGKGAIRLDVRDLDAHLERVNAAPARTQPTTGGAA